MFGGLAAYFWIKEDVPMSLDMQDVRILVAICASGLAISSLIGMFATAEDSRILSKLVRISLFSGLRG